MCFFSFVFLDVGPDLLTLFSPTPIQPLHLSLPLLLSSTHPPSAHFSSSSMNSLTLNPFPFPRFCLVVFWFVVAVHLLHSILKSELLLWRRWLCSLMVNFDESTDCLSLMHGGGSLPRIHALQISCVGSHGPSSTGSDGRSSGSSGGCLVLGCAFRGCVCLRVFCCVGPQVFVLWLGFYFV